MKWFDGLDVLTITDFYFKFIGWETINGNFWISSMQKQNEEAIDCFGYKFIYLYKTNK